MGNSRRARGWNALFESSAACVREQERLGNFVPSAPHEWLGSAVTDMLLPKGRTDADASSSLGIAAGSVARFGRCCPAGKAEGQWVLGFLSAVGDVDPDRDPLRGTDAQGVWAWADNYCRDHPTDTIIIASETFLRAHPN